MINGDMNTIHLKDYFDAYFINSVPVLAAIVIAVIAVFWAYFTILVIAKQKDLVDIPNARKLQKTPVPVMGGVVVFFGVAMGLLAGYTVGGFLGVEFRTLMMPVLAAMVIMLYIGAMDDIIGLSPKVRFIVEVITILGLIYASGSCIDSFHGMWGIQEFSWWIAVPLTVLAAVGIINSINMLDGVNGLCSTLCMMLCALYGLVFVRAADVASAILAFSTAAALVPFILYNIFGHRSRMYIGDAGTLMMGLQVAWFTICVLRSDSPIPYYATAEGVNMIAFTLAVLCVPIFDTLRVMLMRIVRKKSPFDPDRTHLHHIFVSVGVSHLFTTLAELLISLLVILGWGLSASFKASLDWQLYIVIILSLALVWGTYGFMNYHVRHKTEFLHELVRFSVRTHLGRTRWWKRITAKLDAPEDALVRRLNVGKFGDVDAFASRQTLVTENQKEQDRKKIVDFMKGRVEVMVFDIVEHSGADKLQVPVILSEEESSGTIRVIKKNKQGEAVIVALND